MSFVHLVGPGNISLHDIVGEKNQETDTWIRMIVPVFLILGRLTYPTSCFILLVHSIVAVLRACICESPHLAKDDLLSSTATD